MNLPAAESLCAQWIFVAMGSRSHFSLLVQHRSLPARILLPRSDFCFGSCAQFVAQCFLVVLFCLIQFLVPPKLSLFHYFVSVLMEAGLSLSRQMKGLNFLDSSAIFVVGSLSYTTSVQ
jgi:membrane-associated PAP2 superfamily phosphatase